MTTSRYVAPGIQRRHRKLYAIQDIPKALRPKLGRVRFVQSLDTDSLAVAKRRAAVLIAEWKAQIEAARDDKPIDDAAFFRAALQRARNAQERQAALRAIEIEAANRAAVTLPHAAGMEPQEVAGRTDAAAERAEHFAAVATGAKVILADHVDDWLATAHLSPRTTDAARREVVAFAKLFPTVDAITKPAIQDHVLEAAKGVARGTIQKRLSYLRSLWRYLQRNKLAPADSEPFDKLDIPKKPRNGNGKRRMPFTRQDLRKLMIASRNKPSLWAAIMLATYTGARFSELTRLKVEDVTEDAFIIREGKSAAAEREIPIHSNIKDFVADLKAQSKDGWLLEGDGLATNNLGERGRTLGKAFGVFKTELGYDERYVFHSIRKTVATMFEETQVPEFIAARILGHTLKTMSYGVYSGGVDLKTKREAMERAIRLNQ